MELIAKRVVDIISTQDWINLRSPTGIRFQSGPTELTITPAGFKVTTPGYDMVHAADHQTFNGQSVSQHMQTLPNTRFNDAYVLRAAGTQEPIQNMRVLITRADGTTFESSTNVLGQLAAQKNELPERLAIRVLGPK